MDLQGVVGDLQGDVGGVHLGHGGFHAVGRVLLLQLRRGVDEEPGAAQLGCHIRQLEGDALLGRDGLAELDALGIAQRVLKRALASACAAMPMRPPSSVDMAILKPSPSLPNRFSLGTFTLLKISSAVEEERIPILS